MKNILNDKLQGLMGKHTCVESDILEAGRRFSTSDNFNAVSFVMLLKTSGENPCLSWSGFQDESYHDLARLVGHVHIKLLLQNNFML